MVRRAAEIRRDEPIPFEDERALGSADVDPPRVARIGRRRGLDNPERAALEFEHRRRSILDLDWMEARGRARAHLRHRPEQPLKHVHGVDRLVHQRAAAVERKRTAPARGAVILGRPIPAHVPCREDRLSQTAGGDHRLHRRDVRLQSILEEHTDLDSAAIRGRDDAVDLHSRHVERLLGEHMKAAADRRDGLVGVEPGRASDRHDIERTVLEKSFDAVVHDAAVRLREALGFFTVRAVDGRDLHAGDAERGTRMRVADVAAAEDADLHPRRRILMLRNQTWSP